MTLSKVLIACEESQEVTKNFRRLGIEAYSCDIIDCSGEHPEWHIKQDVLPLLNGNCKFKTCDGAEHEVVGKWDAIISFPPCFVAGTKILTKEGVKNIEDVQVGDYVLTHMGRYKRVYNTMSKPTNELCSVLAESSNNVVCTPNHKFYTNIVNRTHENHTNKRVISEDFTWLAPKDFKEFTSYNEDKNNKKTYKTRVYLTSICDDIYEIPDYKGVVVNNNLVNTLPIDNPDFWYFVGRWVGDGFFYKKKVNGEKKIYGAILCCGKHEKDELDAIYSKLNWKPTIREERTTFKYDIYSKELVEFLKNNFGEYADKKTISGCITRLPKNLAESFIDGYISADGYINDKRIEFSTVSENLAYSMQYMFRKYKHLPCTIKKEQNRNVIEGRIVNTLPIYHCYCNIDTINNRYLRKNNYLLYPHKTTITTDRQTIVYNLSVEEDESYTANGFIVHNCTHLAVSGAPHFEKKRADGRQREGIEFFCQFLNADCDKLVIENPINIISGDYVKKWFPDLAEKYGIPVNPTQRIHPWMFGDNHSKNTCLWIKGLPPLVPEVTEQPELDWFEWVDSKTGVKKRQDRWFYEAFTKTKTSEERQKVRSKTFPGIARAMAEQWGKLI